MTFSRKLVPLLVTLLLLDALFVVAHLIWAEDHKRWWDLGEDQSAAEWFQYAKFLAAAALLVLVWTRVREIILVGWAGIFLFLSADDALQGHEKVGGRFMRLFMDDAEDLAFGSIRWQDVGEILAACLFVAPMLLMLAWGWRRASEPVRDFSKRLFALCALLAFAGVGIDFFVNGLADNRFGDLAFFLEDGTEMVAVSLIVWTASLAWANPDTIAGYGKATLSGRV